MMIANLKIFLKIKIDFKNLKNEVNLLKNILIILYF